MKNIAETGNCPSGQGEGVTPSSFPSLESRIGSEEYLQLHLGTEVRSEIRRQFREIAGYSGEHSQAKRAAYQESLESERRAAQESNL